MPEYIDREAVIDKIYSSGLCSTSFVDEIDDIPAADVEPVRHGRWIPTTMSNSTGPIVRCSICGQYINPSATAIEFGRQSLEPRWCEKCGAKMDMKL